MPNENSAPLPDVGIVNAQVQEGQVPAQSRQAVSHLQPQRIPKNAYMQYDNSYINSMCFMNPFTGFTDRKNITVTISSEIIYSLLCIGNIEYSRNTEAVVLSWRPSHAGVVRGGSAEDALYMRNLLETSGMKEGDVVVRIGDEVVHSPKKAVHLLTKHYHKQRQEALTLILLRM